MACEAVRIADRPVGQEERPLVEPVHVAVLRVGEPDPAGGDVDRLAVWSHSQTIEP